MQCEPFLKSYFDDDGVLKMRAALCTTRPIYIIISLTFNLNYLLLKNAYYIPIYIFIQVYIILCYYFQYHIDIQIYLYRLYTCLLHIFHFHIIQVHNIHKQHVIYARQFICLTQNLFFMPVIMYYYNARRDVCVFFLTFYRILKLTLSLYKMFEQIQSQNRVRGQYMSSCSCLPKIVCRKIKNKWTLKTNIFVLLNSVS